MTDVYTRKMDVSFRVDENEWVKFEKHAIKRFGDERYLGKALRFAINRANLYWDSQEKQQNI